MTNEIYDAVGKLALRHIKVERRMAGFLNGWLFESVRSRASKMLSGTTVRR
jgi:hypothetical protein